MWKISSKQTCHAISIKTITNKKMPALLLLFVSFIFTFSTMMQQTLAEDILTNEAICGRQKCENNCPSVPISHNLTRHDLIEKSFTLTNHQNHSVTCICPVSCRTKSENCTFPFEGRLLHFHDKSELKNPNDPCEIFYCNNGVVAIHMATCAAIDCPLHDRKRPFGECCDICDIEKSTFCDDNHDCDIACRYGYERNVDDDCDLCKCARLTKSTTSTTTEAPSRTSEEELRITNDEEEKVVFFFFTTESKFLNYLIIGVIFIAALAFACFLAFIIWMLHRRIYNRVPLISHMSHKIGGQYA